MVIRKLSDLVVSQIAAGEVIESPAGAVKEILENALDAKADKIEIFLRGGGLESIQVRDNGTGMGKEDLPLAVESFATSKIEKLDDLYTVRSMGFRGEALSSICSVSRVSIESKTKTAKNGWKIVAEAGNISPVEACPFGDSGTRVIVDNLFFNVPIRKKFLNSEKKIRREVQEIITSYALAWPSISFTYNQEGKEIFRFPAKENLLDRVAQVFGMEFNTRLLPVYVEEEGHTLEGYISGLDFFHSHNSFLRFFINKRKVFYKPLTSILRRAYGELLPPGKYPAAVLFLNTDTEELDVNVHPQKKEVKFKNPEQVERKVYLAIKAAIEGDGNIPSSHFIKTTERVAKKHQTVYEQGDLNLRPPLVVKDGTPDLEYGAPVENEVLGRPSTIHGTLYDTLVMASSPEGIYLIDQHTAHERIRYEEILAKLETSEPPRQALMDPVSFYPSPEKIEALLEGTPILEKLGFEFEDLGPAGYRLAAVPSYVRSGEEENSLELALSLLDKDINLTPAQLFDRLAKSMACRSAIKKGDSATTYELSRLIEKLYKCKNPARCPHGRPTVIFMGKKDLFGFFKREV
ncbi:MAG: DNA mismatch repair endonuclease MutL [Leptospirales bacterium]